MGGDERIEVLPWAHSKLEKNVLSRRLTYIFGVPGSAKNGA